MGVASWCRHCAAERRKPGIHQERKAKAALAAEGLKRCGSCLQILSALSFSIRRASNDGLSYRCIECNKTNNRKWRERNPEAFRDWHKQNAEHRSAYFKAWREQNLEQRARSIAAWGRENRHRVNANNAKRIAAKYRATVAWADRDAIRAFYAEAARLTDETGIRHEVDHIYPLQGELVCGLHCEANLQILTKEENIRKLNRMPVDISA
jgi:hypothetical protein